MSHTTKLAGFVIDDFEALQEAAKQIGAKITETDTVEMWNKNRVRDCVAAVKLPLMKFPLAVTKDGQVQYDGYASKSGWREQLNDFKQVYSGFRAILEAKKTMRFKKVLQPKKTADGWLEMELLM